MLRTHNGSVKHLGSTLNHLVDIKAIAGIETIDIGVHHNFECLESPADFAQHTADGIVDVTLDDLFACCFQCIGIGIQLSSIPSGIVIGFLIENMLVTQWTSLEVDKDVTFFRLPHKVDTTCKHLAIFQMREGALMIDVRSLTIFLRQPCHQFFPSSSDAFIVNQVT